VHLRDLLVPTTPSSSSPRRNRNLLNDRFELDPAVRENVIGWEGEAGAAWLRGLPTLVEDLAVRWELRDFGAPLPGGSHSYVAPVRSPFGETMLKVPLLGDENRLEAEALRLYAGDGAVRLQRHDARSGAMLQEACSPGTPLLEAADREAAIDIACGLLRRLRREPPAGHSFIRVADKASEWAKDFAHELHRGVTEEVRPMMDEAAGLARELATDRAPGVLVNRDAHRGNFLAAEREVWLLIDPKPLVGDPAFDAGYLLADLAGSSPDPADVSHLVERLADGLEVEAARLRAWALIRAIDNVLWYRDLGQDAPAETRLAEALRGN
jgi:streptomycin 6-kinase